MRLRFTFPVKAVVLCIMTALSFCHGAAAQSDTVHEIKDPYYGDALFEFYQGNYFATLTGLMVSQHFGRVPHYNEETEVLRGGILLSYGLHREAGEVFEKLIDIGATPVTRDRAWFYLAKIRYQRGYLSEAEAALNHIGNALPEQFTEERALLQANLMMARGDYAAAVPVLDALHDSTSDYVHYNLGIALIKSGNTARGIALLDQLGQQVENDEEHRSLRDRANLALGFSAVTSHQPAALYFERIRLKSAQANKALLGLGWARVADKDFKQALVAWQELAQRDDNDTAEFEAKIAVPYAYAELGAYGQSARLYNDAVSFFGQEETDLNESITAIEEGKLVEALLADNPGKDMGWFWNIKALPDMPHASHLAHVLAQHDFQEAFKNYRDLRFLTLNLEQWRDKLGVFQDMLDNRRTAFGERLPQVMAQHQHIGLDAMRERQAALTSLINEAETDTDGVVFASTQQAELLSRAGSAQRLIYEHRGEPEFDAARQRVRLAQGTLLWQLAQDYPERDWQARKNLQVIAQQLTEAQQLEADLQQAQRDEPQRFDQLAARIKTMAAQLNNLMPRLAALTLEQQQAVQNIAISQLKYERALLAQYTTQARFALAQLYDRSSMPSESADAKKQPEASHAP